MDEKITPEENLLQDENSREFSTTDNFDSSLQNYIAIEGIRVKFGIWQSIKLGIGFAIGLLTVGAVFWIFFGVLLLGFIRQISGSFLQI